MDEFLSSALLSPVLDFYVRGDEDTALALCDSIAKDHPDCADAFALLAELQQRAGDSAGWLTNARRAYDLDPIRFRQALIQAQASVALLHAETDSPYELLQDLSQLLALKSGDEAEAILHFLLERHRDDLPVIHGVRSLLQRHGRDSLLPLCPEVAPLALLVLPARSLDCSLVARFIKSIRQNLGIDGVHIASRGNDPLSGTVPEDWRFVSYDEDRLICYSHLVYADDGADQSASTSSASRHPKVYRLDQSTPGYAARLMPVGREVSGSDYPYVSSHIFNHVTQRLHGHYYYFPYGYLFRYLGYGPINAFGHRIDRELQSLKQRPARHKLITCFGGSSCFSMYCLHDEMFASRLEARLNDWAATEDRDLEFTVLNFGQHGNVVLNELTTYLLFVQELKPDVVLAHDGFNDLMYGQFSDQALVADEHIVYQDNLEEWAAMLNGSKNDLPSDRYVEGIRQVRNQPGDVIDAYLARLGQFSKIAMADGSRFVWGLQPWLGGKRNPTPHETEFLRESMDDFSPFRDGYRNLPFLYEMLRARSSEVKVTAQVDLHNASQALEAGATHFYDIVHLSPEGDEAIASSYLPTLKGLFS